MTDNNNNTTTTTKNDLMASLLMASGDDLNTGGGDGDLFGDALPPPELGTAAGVVVSEAPPLAVDETTTPPPPLAAAAAAVVPPTPQPATETAPSLLAQSGLLGMMATATDTTTTTTAAAPDMGSDDNTNSGGGLFDAVDQEEQEAQQRAQEEAAARQQKAAEEEAERQRQQAEQQHQEELARQQQQQQQSNNNNNMMMMMGGSYPPFQDGNNSMTQQSAMMQSVNLNAAGATPTNHHAYAGMTTPQQQQQQQQQSLQAGMQNMTLQQQQQQQPPPQAGFYREHPPSVVQTTGGPPPPQNAYGGVGGPGGGGYYYGTQQPQQQQQMSHPQPPMPQPNITAGMHNAAMMNAMNHQHPQNQVRKIVLMKPTEVPPVFTNIQVTEPMLIQQASFLISSPPYWSYQIATQLAPPQQGTWLVRRRFKHVVALEDRLRQACPGSILPPRPDKHATRAIEEASAQQSAEFAMQRALELQTYLNALAKHPVAGQSQVFRLFVGLQDDIGTAWPEVSGNAFTKLGAVAANVSSKVAETTSSHQASTRPVQEWEEDAELLALTSSENVRMGAVCQAVPKLEGTVTLWREYGDAAGAVGMEMSKVTKVPDNADLQCLNVLSTGMLRLGRRNKRLALEMSAAMNTFLQQYKMVRYEKMALQDRRAAMQRRNSTRRGADQRAMYLSQQQGTLQTTGQYGHLNRLEQSAIHTDSFANALVGEADEIAARLKSEIHRVAIDRRTQWNASMKTIAKAMKDACSERIAIWESTLEAFEALPGVGGGGAPPVMEVNVAATPGAAGNNHHHSNNMMPVSPMMMMDGSMMGGSQMMVNGGTTAPGDNMMSQSMNHHVAPPQQQHQQQQNEPPMDGSTIYA